MATHGMGGHAERFALGDAARLEEDGTLGVVCGGPTRDGNVSLMREDASTTGYMQPSLLARPSEAELAAQPWLAEPRLGKDTWWVELGTALRAGSSTLGVVCEGPDRDDNVKLVLEDASSTGYIKASLLVRPSEAELAAQPWLTECWETWV